MEKGISLSLKRFIAHFCGDIRQEKRFCFILGAGASKASRIPTGAELARKWIRELEEQDSDDLEEWLEEKGIDKNDYAIHYSDIFDKRFELSRKDGFAFLESVMSKAEPSCGYSVLAQILARDKHNIVITTNFDSLTEDALFIYTQKKPLVIGHSALAGYITANPSRPLVIKIHHDLLLSPKNTTEETSKLDDNFTKSLKEIFKRYTPLVIGYGGNDGSLMSFLESLEHFEEGMFWFYMNEEDIKPEVEELVQKAKGHFVKISGFDHLMIQLGNKLGLEKLDGEIENIAKDRADRYRKQIEDLNRQDTTDHETKIAVGEITSRGKKNWWNYVLTADAEKDIKKADAIYQEGLKEFPESSELLGDYAIFLDDIKKDYVKAEKCYQKSLELNSENANLNCNYAIFLKNIKRDYVGAEKYYQKSLELNPENANLNGNYAIFLKNIKRNYEEAGKYYRKSLELNPNDANVNCNYAIFLDDIKEDYIEAEKYYRKSLELNPDNAMVNCNYAVFLSDIKKDYIEAEKYYQKSLELNPDNADANNNYADFLCNIKKEYIEAEKYYRKSLELDSNNAKANRNYAKILLICDRSKEALTFIENAFSCVSNDDIQVLLELWFYCYAVFPEKFPESRQKIEELLEQSVKSIAWNLSEIVKIAEKEKHPEIEKVREFAAKISGE